METDLNTNEILEKYNQTIGQGNEPIRELRKTNDIDTWSYIDSYERKLLTQLKFMSKTFNIKMIETEIINPYLRLGLSVDGKARIQFEKAHTGLLEILKPLLAGVGNDKIGSLETKNRKL
jgi:hypothetical protein